MKLPQDIITAQYRRLARHGGFTLVSAIFLLVALAALGAAIVRLSTTQQVTSAQDLQGSRAYQAARAGVEWGVYQVMAPDNPTYTLPGCFGNTSFSLEGFSVVVSCAQTQYLEAADRDKTIAIYQLISTASSGGAVGDVNRIERQIKVLVSKCGVAVGPAFSPCSSD